MYLLHCSWDESSTDLSISLESYTGSIPKYAILSHRWATNPQDEVTFEDMTMRIETAREKSGFEKIRGCCAQALRDGLHWVWIDTCCIDKRSSAELSEAINSMYSWYEKSEICYAYLEDVYIPAEDEKEFRKSSWFTRGWTLQELIAPAEVEFFTNNWVKIGTKSGLASTLAEITGVAESALINGVHAYKASVAEKMSWAAHRKTTRAEDRAYSLMGIFEVNMPTLYGEGHRAFARLQQEIMRISHDHSIFAWQRKSLTAGLLAESPDEFAHSSTCYPADYQKFIETFNISKPKPDFVMTNFGLHIQLPLAPIPEFDGYYVAYLACTASDRRQAETQDWGSRFTHQEWEYGDDEWVAIFLHRQPGGIPGQFTRTSLQNHMLGRGIDASAEYESEPIWVSLNDDISPLLWKSPETQISPFLQLPSFRLDRDDTVTVIMEQRFRHTTILNVYPNEAFSGANEVSLKGSDALYESLAVMVVQNERGKDRMMVAFWIDGDHLIAGYGTALDSDSAHTLHTRFLTTGCTLSEGFVTIPVGTPGESFINKNGFFVSLECVGALAYRFGMVDQGLGPYRDF
ncbi:hypothetical protein Neosp_007957 [[Neocosmospora] mangrovei]